MKRISIRLIVALTLLGLFTVQCSDEFSDLNQNPNDITDPDVAQLLTDGLYKMCGQEYLLWFYNNSVYFWRCEQLTVSRAGTSYDFNTVEALGGVSVYDVMVDMKEIRSRIDNMSETDKANYAKFRAITYIPQIYLGIMNSDWQGSMCYSEAVDARYTGNVTPKYDSQETLFNTWLTELDNAITTLLTDDSQQVSPDDQDFIYEGDWTAWARLANSLKLRIAARLEYANPTKMKEILNEVVSQKDGSGNPLLITETSQQAVWAPGSDEYGPGGTNSLWIENYAPSQNFSKFMVRNEDPRLNIFFVENDLSDAAIDSLTVSGITLPEFAKKPVTEPWDRLVGGPVAADSNSIVDYFGSTMTDRNGTIYDRLPYVDYNLFKPKQNGRSGEYWNVFLGAPEVCLYLAEFIEKGYITASIGTAKDWYEKGVRISCENYNTKADKAQVPDYTTRQITTAQIDSLLKEPDIKYINGDSKNVEKIILQEIVNLFDNPYEGVAVARRTGYPSRTSTIWAWQPYYATGTEVPMPRRFPWTTPSDATNKANWQDALSDQGFTADAKTFEVLNVQRVWWDESCPNYGNGSK